MHADREPLQPSEPGSARARPLGEVDPASALPAEVPARPAKLADVARAAGVSQGTASNVFNRPHIVRPEVRARVEASARRLGYSGPDPRGRLLRAGRVNAVGVVTMPAMGLAFRDPCARQLLAGIAEECEARGAALTLVPALRPEDGASPIQTALVDGFVVSCPGNGDALLALARRRNLPFVAVDFDAGPGTSSVLVQERRGGYLGAHHLLELGHRRMAMLSLEPEPAGRGGWCEPELLRAAEHRSVRERAAGWEDALAARGLSLHQLPVVAAANDPAAAARAVAQLLAARPDTTAVLAMSDALALGALAAARQRGLRVPEELSVIGFDDVVEAASAGLSTVAQPSLAKGRLAAQLVLDAAAPRTAMLDVCLVLRGSTGSPRVAACA